MSGLSELTWVYGGLTCLAASFSHALRAGWGKRLREARLHRWLLFGALAFGMALAERWLRTGFGPFATLFDILLSNLFSLSLVYGVVCWRSPHVRTGSLAAIAVLILMGGWLISVPREASALPTAFDSYWLWVHLITGKLFFGLTLAAASVAVALLIDTGLKRSLESAEVVMSMDMLVWRLISAGFVLHGLMLIAGAIWAQDAWGRYWAWDPLETWSFLTWLLMGIALHARVTFLAKPIVGWLLVVAIFVIAFMTLFGVPFLSTAPHRGVI